MSVDTKILTALRGINLSGQEMRIFHAANDHRSYKIDSFLGEQGMTSLTYSATDSLGFRYAIKIVPKTYYKDHSIAAEVSAVQKLSRRKTKIVWYGDPLVATQENNPDINACYAIVIEWVEGMSIKNFVESLSDTLDIEDFFKLTEQLCEALALLEHEHLVHNDLHPGNILVTKVQSGPALTPQCHLTVIDSGSIKTRARQHSLLEQWEEDLFALKAMRDKGDDKVAPTITNTERRIEWFSRTDQEWITCHLCMIANCLRRREHNLPARDRRFLSEATEVLSKMVDPDPNMRLASPNAIYNELDLLRRRTQTPPSAKMVGPFDLISAELIRSDIQLNRLFSDKAPWFKKCASNDPVYIYGPRGCGKSTILRKLSLSSSLTGDNPCATFEATPYLGVYISCSSELRSRFWLFPTDRYPAIQGDAVLFFTMLLVEALLDSLELLRDGVVESSLGQGVGLTAETARQIAVATLAHFNIGDDHAKLEGVSWLRFARKRIQLARQMVWKRILTEPSKSSPNPALIFDLCKELEEIFPLLKSKHIAFLLDDYSNQRIPVSLQRVLNQTISFAKQGNPIFKVSSEYSGVDLDGIQEGREVVEVNFGSEYLELNDQDRGAFLEDILNIRFVACEINTTIERFLGRSNLQPGLPMARAIKAAEENSTSFYYHGIDTISDVCSGDVAMAIDLINIYMKTQSTSERGCPNNNSIR